MNTRMIGFLLGRILMVEAGLLALPLLTALLYGEPLMPWLATMLVLAAIGGALSLRKPERTALYAKDGFAAVALVWLLMSAFGALPFVLSGDIPNYIDAFFETVSGFTTTGASILTAVEPLSRGGLFWRSFTHWVGGMGVLVFVMAILPMSDGHTMHILRAEMPGPTAGKLVSRMSDTAKILYGMYFVMTLVMIGLLLLGGMDLFDASVHAFGAAGTGGFSSRNASVGAYNSAYIDVVTGIGMLAFGINFNLWLPTDAPLRDVAKSEELCYLGIVAFSTVTIAANIRHLYGAVGTSQRHAFFQVSSIITTTGYATVDFDQWPGYAKTVLVLLMFVGGCGPTGGLKGHPCGDIGEGCLYGYAENDPPQRRCQRADGELAEQVRAYRPISKCCLLGVLAAAETALTCCHTFTALSACITTSGLRHVRPTRTSRLAFSVGQAAAFDMLAGPVGDLPHAAAVHPPPGGGPCGAGNDELS